MEGGVEKLGSILFAEGVGHGRIWQQVQNHDIPDNGLDGSKTSARQACSGRC